jgi:hypothetical protein
MINSCLINDDVLGVILKHASLVTKVMVIITCKSLYEKRKNMVSDCNLPLINNAADENSFEIVKELRASGHELKCMFSYYAARSGNLEMLKWAHAEGCGWNNHVIGVVAAIGNIEMLKWCLDNGCPYKNSDIGQAAVRGHVAVLEWWKENDYDINEGCNIDTLAATYGHIPVLEWMLENFFDIRYDVLHIAAKSGNLETVKWIRYNLKIPITTKVMAGAARSGVKEIVEWLCIECGKLEEDDEGDEDDYKLLFNEEVFDEACISGDFEFMKWLHSKGCPVGPQSCSIVAPSGNLEAVKWLHGLSVKPHEDVCTNAAEERYFEIVKWALENNYPCDEDTIYDSAIYDDNVEMVEWLYSRGFPVPESICAIAASSMSIGVIKWGHDRGFPLDEEFCAEAASCGLLDVIVWARERGCPWDSSVYDRAALEGHVSVMQYAKDNGLEILETAYEEALLTGQIKVLEWLKENNAPYNVESSFTAAKNKQFTALRWLVKEGFAISSSAAFKCVEHGDSNLDLLESLTRAVGGTPSLPILFFKAACFCQLETLKWLYSRGCKMTSEVCASAAARGRLDIIKWARENGCPWDSETCTNAAESGHLKVLKWAVENGCPFNYYEVEDISIHGGYYKTVEWIANNIPKNPQ